jgi:hypothetical protein
MKFLQSFGGGKKTRLKTKFYFLKITLLLCILYAKLDARQSGLCIALCQKGRTN